MNDQLELELINAIAKCIGDEIDYSVKFSNTRYLLSKFDLIYCFSATVPDAKVLKIDLDTYDSSPLYYANRGGLNGESLYIMDVTKLQNKTLKYLNERRFINAAVINMFVLHADKLTDIMREFDGEIYLEIGPRIME